MDKLILISHITKQIAAYTSNKDLPIYQSKGLRAHVHKRHAGCEKYLSRLSDIIDAPDYIGVSPREAASSFELVKILDENVQVGIKLDQSGDYYYVATLYTITEGKLQARIRSGRLKEI